MGAVLKRAKAFGFCAVAGFIRRINARRTLRRDRRIISRSHCFDEQWYLEQYPDVAAAGVDPFRHYLLNGTIERRSPNPFFDADWYLAENQDVAANNVNPLVHYLQHGAGEGRNPSPSFDSSWYLAQNPDVRNAGINPLAHYCSFGQREGRQRRAVTEFPEPFSFLPITSRHLLGFVMNRQEEDKARSTINSSNRSVLVEELLPTGMKSPSPPEGQLVDIIVPVYRGFEETRRCVESVLGSRTSNRAFGRLVLIDDCSPEPELRSYLRKIEKHEAVLLLTNPTNEGFVCSVNRGMRNAGSHDIIILNSDTEVCGNWVDRLTARAYANPETGTVTPLSNNATICSYPTIGGQPMLPAGVTLRDIDAASSEANALRAVEIPTGVGSCMFIKGKCLREVGYFDEDAFGEGYGEETDFCQRASRLGWHHLLAGDVFIFHVGEVSFGARGETKRARAAAIIKQRYPNYMASVASWVQRDPALPLRLALTAALLRRLGRPIILHIVHSWGGGTEKQVAELALGIQSALHVVLAIRRRERYIGFLLLFPEDSKWRAIEFSAGAMADVAPLLCSLGMTQIHVHSFMDVIDQLSGFLKIASIPYDISIHDYSAICPRINLFEPDVGYCNEPEERGCLSCLAKGGAAADDILWWRYLGLSLIAEADRVICPSADSEKRIRRYIKDARTIVAPHEPVLYRPVRTTRIPTTITGKPLRVAVIGILNGQKGAKFLLDCVEAAVKSDASVAWNVIGEFAEPFKPRATSLKKFLTITGRYRTDDVQRLIDNVEPHIILFSQRAPETYSFSLSEALQSGYPILAPEIGAFTERLRGLPGCWLYPIDARPTSLVEQLLFLRDNYLMKGRYFVDSGNAMEGVVRLDFFDSCYVHA